MKQASIFMMKQSIADMIMRADIVTVPAYTALNRRVPDTEDIITADVIESGTADDKSAVYYLLYQYPAALQFWRGPKRRRVCDIYGEMY